MFDYQAPAQLLKDKVIVVTGAGDGIGATAARTYAQHGATVVLLGRTTAKLEAVYDDIVAQGHPQPALYPMNLQGATEADYNNLAVQLKTNFGAIHGLLHNASLLGARTPISGYSFDTWQQLMQVNVTAGFLMTKALIPVLELADAASIVFTSSSVGRKGRAYWGAYAVSKFATEGLMQTLADEMHDLNNIRVNSINPGATRTNMRKAAYPGENPADVAAAEDIMPLYLYLMGQDSLTVNGASMNAQ